VIEGIIVSFTLKLSSLLRRDVDFISPFMTPLTYEGLVDNCFGISNGEVKFDASEVGELEADQPEGAKKKKENTLKPGDKVAVQMTNDDAIFSEIRSLSIEQLGVFLQEKAIRIKESYTSFRGNKDASISEIHKFVKQIPHLTKEYKSLNHHIHIAEMIKRFSDTRDFREQWQLERGMLEGENFLDQLEDVVCSDTDGSQAFRIIRLLCLQSVTAGGLRANKYDQLKRMMAQVYGFEYVFTLHFLEKLGVLRRKDAILSVVESSSVWQTIRKPLRLINESINMSRPDDIAYVTAGYAPLSVRLMQVQCGSAATSQTFAAEMRSLPGPYIEFTQHANSADDISEALARFDLTADFYFFFILVHQLYAMSYDKY